MNNKWISSFLAVAQEGSINAAARALYISPQALLQQINLLEEEVGTPLFFRQRRGMTLTLSGHEFLRGAQQLKEIYTQTLSRCRLTLKAEYSIRIPMMSSIVLPRFMEAVVSMYKQRDDALQIELLSDDDFDHRLEGLRNLKYDIIEYYSIDGHHPPDVHFEFIAEEPSWCIMAEHHSLAGKAIILPEDLDGCTLLTPGINVKLMGYLTMYLDSHAIRIDMKQIDNDRYQIIDGINRGGVYLANEEIARIFVGFRAAPLDFDNHVQHGLVCRSEMTETYKPFFETAHTVAMMHE